MNVKVIVVTSSILALQIAGQSRQEPAQEAAEAEIGDNALSDSLLSTYVKTLDQKKPLSGKLAVMCRMRMRMV